MGDGVDKGPGWVEFSRKCNKGEGKINGMGWNLWQNFGCQVKKLESFSKNPTAKFI